MIRRTWLSVAAISAPLMWSNWALPALGLGIRGRTAANAGFATGYSFALRQFGSDFESAPWITKRGLIVGGTAALVPVVALAVAARIPAARAVMGQRSGDHSSAPEFAEWTLVHIPIGTVYAEELIFRATLDPLLENLFGSHAGLGVSALTFGLWHIRPARAAGDSVVGTVAATSLVGLVFSWLRRRSGSVGAPALVHLVTNVFGAVVDRAVGGK